MKTTVAGFARIHTRIVHLIGHILSDAVPHQQLAKKTVHHTASCEHQLGVLIPLGDESHSCESFAMLVTCSRSTRVTHGVAMIVDHCDLLRMSWTA